LFSKTPACYYLLNSPDKAPVRELVKDRATICLLIKRSQQYQDTLSLSVVSELRDATATLDEAELNAAPQRDVLPIKLDEIKSRMLRFSALDTERLQETFYRFVGLTDVGRIENVSGGDEPMNTAGEHPKCPKHSLEEYTMAPERHFRERVYGFPPGQAKKSDLYAKRRHLASSLADNNFIQSLDHSTPFLFNLRSRRLGSPERPRHLVLFNVFSALRFGEMTNYIQ
jgi:hypothetical protein